MAEWTVNGIVIERGEIKRISEHTIAEHTRTGGLAIYEVDGMGR